MIGFPKLDGEASLSANHTAAFSIIQALF